jgi:hypothetical protein
MGFKYYTFKCLNDDCDNRRGFDELVTDDEDAITCAKCHNRAVKSVQMAAGYQIRGANSGSTRPRHSGSWKRGK